MSECLVFSTSKNAFLLHFVFFFLIEHGNFQVFNRMKSNWKHMHHAHRFCSRPLKVIRFTFICIRLLSKYSPNWGKKVWFDWLSYPCSACRVHKQIASIRIQMNGWMQAGHHLIPIICLHWCPTCYYEPREKLPLFLFSTDASLMTNAFQSVLISFNYNNQCQIKGLIRIVLGVSLKTINTQSICKFS